MHACAVCAPRRPRRCSRAGLRPRGHAPRRRGPPPSLPPARCRTGAPAPPARRQGCPGPPPPLWCVVCVRGRVRATRRPLRRGRGSAARLAQALARKTWASVTDAATTEDARWTCGAGARKCETGRGPKAETALHSHFPHSLFPIGGARVRAHHPLGPLRIRAPGPPNPAPCGAAAPRPRPLRATTDRKTCPRIHLARTRTAARLLFAAACASRPAVRVPSSSPQAAAADPARSARAA